MSRSITTLTWGLCLVTGLALVQPALAHPKSLPAIGSAVGQVTSFEVTSADPVTGVPLTAVQTAVVMGRGSVLGHHVNQVTVFLDFVTGQASGSFEITSDHSSTSVVGSFTAYFQPIDGTPWIEFHMTGTIEDGTGRLDGATGVVEIVAFENIDTFEVEYDYTGVFEFDE